MKRNQPFFRFERASPASILGANDSLHHSLSEFHRIFITDYLEWHAYERAAYEGTLRLNEGHHLTAPVRPPRMLIVRSDLSITHGLGDRFRAIVVAYMLAVISNRVLLIDWRHPIPLSLAFASSRYTNFTYDDFLAPSQPFNDSAVIEGNYYHLSDRIHVNVTTLFLDSVPRPNISRWFSPPQGRKRENALLRRLSALEPLPACRVFPLIFRALFSPTQKLRDALSARLQTSPISSLNAEKTTYVGVHARLGYGLGEVKSDATRFDLAQSGSSIRGMARCFSASAVDLYKKIEPGTSRKQPQFFLATDTPSFRSVLERELSRRLPGAALTYVNADVKHIRDLQVKTESDIQTFMDIFVDIFLLSWSDAMTNLRSGFSDLGVWMGGICEQHVVTSEECAIGYGVP